MTGYQPTWRDGTETSPGTRDTETRYNTIHAYLSRLTARLKRPITVLDLGANTGYFSIRISEDFRALITAVDTLPALKKIEAQSDRITVKQTTIDRWNLPAFPRHDVVLCLSFLHHLPDWRESFPLIRRLAKHAVIVEVPHPDEQLKYVPAKNQLGELYAVVNAQTVSALGTAQATRQPELSRLVSLVSPLLVGRVFSGGGNHARTQERHSGRFAETLGYTPYPGSLNVRLPHPVDFGPPHLTVTAKHTYNIWKARIRDVKTPIHLMSPPSARSWPDTIEVLAPVRLRDQLASSTVEIDLWEES